MQQEAEEAHSKYLLLNSGHKEKLREVYEGIKKNKKWQYLSMEEQSQEADRFINDSKRSNQEEKSKVRGKIAAEEESGKRSLIHFHESKQSRIKEVKVS